MVTVCFLNAKGGVGKTSCVYHLAGALRARGLRVLLVDNDPQASLTEGFYGPHATAAMDPLTTLAEVYRLEGEVDPGLVTRAVNAPAGVDLVAGSLHVSDANVPHGGGWPGTQWALRTFLEQPSGYDVCLVDCPPTLALCARAALLAAAWVVIPLQAESFGSHGMAPVRRAVAAAAESNPGLRTAGLLLTMFDRRLAVHQTYADTMREKLEGEVFEAVVPRAKDYVEAVAARRPVGLYRPRSSAAEATEAVAAELLARVGLGVGGVVGQGGAAA